MWNTETIESDVTDEKAGDLVENSDRAQNLGPGIDMVHLLIGSHNLK